MYLGCHLSFSKGYEAMGASALSIGANTFQFFSRNPRGGGVRPFDPADADRLKSLMIANDFAPFVIHAPYTVNPCSKDPKALDFARLALREDIERAEYFENALYNLHPGCHVGQGISEGIRIIAETLNQVMFDGMRTTVLLETMAGKGTEIGSEFEQLQRIIESLEHPERVGVCLDTCHVYDGCYDIVDHLEEVLENFDNVIGIDRLKAIHINDSKNPMGSRKDRHECIGKGSIGTAAFVRILQNPNLRSLPFILETPNELDGYRDEIQMLRALTAD